MADTDELLRWARAELARAAACDGLESVHHTAAAAAAYGELDEALSDGDPVPVPWLLARRMRRWSRDPSHEKNG